MIKYFIFFALIPFSIHLALPQQNYVLNNIDDVKHSTSWSEFKYNAGNIGFWGEDELGLPTFHFAAELPLKTIQPNGKVEGDPTDPVFLIGNYRYNMFIHASGDYSVMSMERATARLNYGNDKTFNTSENKSTISINGEFFPLTGKDSEMATSLETEKVFGTGYALFNYKPVKDVKVTRVISTPPSVDIKTGCSGAIITVEVENRGSKKVKIELNEAITARYHLMVWDNPPFGKRRIDYPVKVNETENKLMASFIPKPKTKLVTAPRQEHAKADGYPPVLIMEGIPGSGQEFSFATKKIDSLATRITGTYRATIKAGEKIRFYYLLGYDINDGIVTWGDSREQLIEAVGGDDIRPFRAQWRKKIPALESNSDKITTMELQWDIYVLESMANWSEFYQETYIPQGTLYDYALGVSAATNDLAMHTLPMSYVNPELAKSALKFILKHVNHRGEIYGSDEGAGRIPVGPFQKSHLHPTTLHALSEYLRINKDAAFLTEEIPFWGYPETNGTVLDRISRLFLYLRDEISTGKNGFVRTMCSDLSDGLYFYFDDKPYFSLFNSESGSNTPLTIVTLENLAHSLENIEDNIVEENQNTLINDLSNAMRDYRKELLAASLIVLKNHNNRMPRVIINGNKFFGVDNLFLEPNAGCLSIPEIPLNIRQQMNDSVYTNMVKNEPLGARNLTFEVPTYKPGGWGVRHNGGYWISRHGYYTIHLYDVETSRAWEMLERMTMKRHSDIFPNYWVGAWSGPDEYNAGVSDRAGLTSGYCQLFPVYCAHQHAWPLYAYLYLTEKETGNE